VTRYLYRSFVASPAYRRQAPQDDQSGTIVGNTPSGHIITAMYKEFYHLKEEPFNITADPDFFFCSSRHTEAVNHLIYGIEQRKGIIVMTGEIGTGKTTLCRILLNRLNHKTKTAFILNPNFSETQLLQMILKDFGLTSKNHNRLAWINSLNEFLLGETSLGHNIALIIDEAQNLRVPQLEQIRLLSNLETEKAKLLQIVLVGQPELFDKLKLPTLRQLNQRICVRYHILPLDKSEVSHYIHHRLQVAKATRKLNFTKEAIDALYGHSQGTPRLINILCDRALLAGFVAESFTIDEKIINKCAREVR